MVSWPWVFLWQVGLLCPLLWLISQIWQQRSWRLLGIGLDAIAVLGLAAIILNGVFAEFSHQAVWYGWAAICHLMALYALNQWCTREKGDTLLQFQAVISIAFIIVSLAVWGGQTVAPELARIAELKAIGLGATFDLSNNNLRNWAPLGHQNYVAGYLVLALPILLGLGLKQVGWQRWLWSGSFILGLVDLYTTNSRAGFLGFAVGLLLFLIGVAIAQTAHRKKLLGLGVASILAGAAIVVTNERLRSLAIDALQGRGILDDYRVITNTVGWRMGLSAPFSGQGLGSVPLVYQQYLPIWGNRRAELAYQLHSTPAQLWGEFGILGILLAMGLTICIAVAIVRRYRPFSDIRPLPSRVFSFDETTTSAERGPAEPLPPPGTSPLLLISILSALVGYSFVSLTDYQLDNPAISGTLTIFLALLAVELRPVSKAIQLSQRIRYVIVGVATALILTLGNWLIPIHRAWQLSSQGFTALLNEDIPTFVAKLEKAHQLAPWEPYYAHQLAWNLGNLAYQTPEPALQETLRQQSVQWFQTATTISPYQEFGYSNLGWLEVNQAPEAATQAFASSAQLVPAKRDVFLGLGYSLLQQGRSELARQACLLEALRHPTIIASPIWQTTPLKSLYPSLLEALEMTLSDLIAQTANPTLDQYWQQSRARLRWWRGDLRGAEQDWTALGDTIGLILTKLAADQPVSAEVATLPDSPEKFTLQAWLSPTEREANLILAWSTYQSTYNDTSTQTMPPELLSELVESMNQADSFTQWFNQTSPTRTLQSQRLGFNTLSRHTDGPTPSDFGLRQERITVSYLFPSLWASPLYQPALDKQLQPLWNQVLEAI
ncbi:MAG: O-antigen ligase family protein [Cyanobacteria bacterium P01_A01_bin.114]